MVSGGPPVVLLDASAAEPSSDEIEHLAALSVLADVKLGHQLPTAAGARVSLDGDVKRSFSVDVTGYVSVEPFLLIARTDRIVTAHIWTLRRGSDMNEYRRILGVSSI